MDVDAIPDRSPGASRCPTLAIDPIISAQTSVQHGEGLGRRKRCVTTSALPDCVTFDTGEDDDEDNGEGETPQDSDDVLWMGCKDVAGVEGGVGMRVRSKTSPASMRWYVERQVGRHLRRISDDFVSHLPSLIGTSDAQPSNDISPHPPDIRSDSHPLPVADVIAPPPPFSASCYSLWRRFAGYFRPRRTRMQSDIVHENESNEEALEVFESSRTVAMQ